MSQVQNEVLPSFYGGKGAVGTIIQRPPSDSGDGTRKDTHQPPQDAHMSGISRQNTVLDSIPYERQADEPALDIPRRRTRNEVLRWVPVQDERRERIGYGDDTDRARVSTLYHGNYPSHDPYSDFYEDDSRSTVNHRRSATRRRDSRRSNAYAGHRTYDRRRRVPRSVYESEPDSGDEHLHDGGGKSGTRPPSPPEEPQRLPLTTWMNSSAKGHFVAALGEFVGTTMFLFFAFAGTQVANAGSRNSANTTTGAATGFSPIVLLYIALAFGFSLMVNVWVFFRISGGLFNPAVTLAMAMVHGITLVRAFLLLIAQLAGSILASFLVSVLFPTPFNVHTTLSAETSIVRGVFIEAILTAELVFTIFMLAKEKHRATFIAPVGIGLALFVAELVGVFYTGGSLNPARSFGPCVVTGAFDQEHWIYCKLCSSSLPEEEAVVADLTKRGMSGLGPAAGAIIAVTFYKFIKILEYEVSNPCASDGDDEKEPRKMPDPEVEKTVEQRNERKESSSPEGK
ncbi:aquaporin-like protein [Cryomyces antarcticus]|nr:hypothetical protein LTR60_000843 [Cryomyces antarcticus]